MRRRRWWHLKAHERRPLSRRWPGRRGRHRQAPPPQARARQRLRCRRPVAPPLRAPRSVRVWDAPTALPAPIFFGIKKMQGVRESSKAGARRSSPPFVPGSAGPTSSRVHCPLRQASTRLGPTQGAPKVPRRAALQVKRRCAPCVGRVHARAPPVSTTAPMRQHRQRQRPRRAAPPPGAAPASSAGSTTRSTMPEYCSATPWPRLAGE